MSKAQNFLDQFESLTIDISKDLKDAIYSTWENVAPDRPESSRMNNKQAIAACLDYLEPFGFPLAQVELHNLIRDYGYKETLSVLSRKVVLV